MSLLVTGPGGAAVPVPSALFGNGTASALFPGATNWQSVPASGSLLSNVYSPVYVADVDGTTPGTTYINNGTIAAGPWTSNSVRSFNVVTQNGPGVIPPACMTPHPRQYMPTVMGSLSRMAAVVPPIALQNTWWPVNQPAVYPPTVTSINVPAVDPSTNFTIPQANPITPAPVNPAPVNPTPVNPAPVNPAPAAGTIVLAQTGADPAQGMKGDSTSAPAVETSASIANQPPYYVPQSTLSYIPTYSATCAGNYVPWARPLQTAYVPYRPRYGFGV